MTRAEIARLKEELTGDYKRKLEALELVEQMLNQQQKSPSPTRPGRGGLALVQVEPDCLGVRDARRQLKAGVGFIVECRWVV
jgi:hypothetical protein